MPVLIPKHNAIFVHVPKNAGTSITTWLLDHIGAHIVKQKHEPYLDYILRKNQTYKFSFAVVRNPYERVVSAFFYNLRLKHNNTREDIKWEDVTAHYKKKKYRKILRRWQIQEIMKKEDFEHFVKSCFHHPIEIPQAKMTEGVDCILRYETLEDDFKQIQEFFDCDKPLIMENQSKHDKYKKYYTSELKKIVENYYKDDFEKFNYWF